MKVAGDPFKELIGSGWKPSPQMADPSRWPVRLEVPKGAITVDGTRRNARMLVEYVEGWLNGRGAKGIDSLAGKPGIHPALMEDLATGRMSTAQIAQRVLHRVKSEDGAMHDFALPGLCVSRARNSPGSDRPHRPMPPTCSHSRRVRPSHRREPWSRMRNTAGPR